MRSLFDIFDEPSTHVRETEANITLRPYQVDSVNAAFERWESDVSTLIVLPTGTGKSVVFSEVMRRHIEESKPGQILVLAHREELIFQARDHAINAGLSAGIEMGNHRAAGEDVIVSTVQTQTATSKCSVCRGCGCSACEGSGKMRRLQQFSPQNFGLLIIDEGHHATAETYRIVQQYYRQNQNLKQLLVTATPKRADNTGLHNVCDSVAYEMELKTAIDEGWLCPIRQRFITVDWLNLSKVGTKPGGDLKDGELERAFLGEIEEEELERLHEIAKACIDEANGDPVLVFTPGVAFAEKLTAAFNDYDTTAEMVIGTTDKLERPEIIKRYKRGDTQVLVGCDVFSEGFDAPGTVVVANVRPTKSLARYMQAIGRGTRPLPGIIDGPETAEERRQAIADSGKPQCLVLDFVGDSGTHKIVSVADVLSGEDVEPLDLEAALREARKATEPVDVEELIEKMKKAREEREKRIEEEKKRVQTGYRAEGIEYTAEDVDIFSGGNFDPFTDYEPTPWMATQKQVNLLINLGVKPETATQYGKGQAGKVIDSMKRRSGGEYIVSFGKHKGRRLADIPRGYLDWMIKKNVRMEELRPHIDAMRETVKA